MSSLGSARCVLVGVGETWRSRSTGGRRERPSSPTADDWAAGNPSTSAPPAQCGTMCGVARTPSGRASPAVSSGLTTGRASAEALVTGTSARRERLRLQEADLQEAAVTGAQSPPDHGLVRASRRPPRHVATPLPRGSTPVGGNARLRFSLPSRCHGSEKRPRGVRGRSGDSSDIGVLDPCTSLWARGDSARP